MRRCEFIDIQSQTKDTKPQLKKEEDTSLPSFSTDMPIASKVKKHKDLIEVNYIWNTVYTNSPFLRIHSIVLKKREQLEKISRLRVRDGIDTIAIRAGAVVYLLRKTTKDIAHAILAAYTNIKAYTEEIVGYLQTLGGHAYSISKISLGAWTFDPHLAAQGNIFNGTDIDRLDDRQKQRLCELIQEKILMLHSKNLVFSSFSTNNLLFTSRELLLTDLRNLRAVRKRSLLVEDFMSILNYLISAGLATRADVYQAIVAYSVAMEDACQEWYTQKKNKKARDNLALIAELERSIYLD